MKKLLFILIIAAGYLLPGCQKPEKEVYLFSYFKNNGEDGLHLAYSYDGLSWTALKNDSSFLTPTAGFDKLMRDPCITIGPDGQFHMVWTCSWKERGIGYASSPDLINWSEQKYVMVMEKEDSAQNCWAPEIMFDDVLQKYIIYWATTIPGHFPETENMGDYNHRIYYTTTSDFETFSDTQLLYDQGFNVIDASIIKTNGEYVMFLKDETRNPPQKNIRVATATSVTGPYTRPSEPITGDYWAEGPTPLQIGNKWYVYFDKYMEHSMGAVASEDLKNWTDVSGQVKFPDGTRHGTAFKVPEKALEKLLKE
jgi:hypothetical protein